MNYKNNLRFLLREMYVSQQVRVSHGEIGRRLSMNWQFSHLSYKREHIILVCEIC